MESEEFFDRYQQLQRYIGWTERDRKLICAVSAVLRPRIDCLIDDFHSAAIEYSDAGRFFSGGEQQFARLRKTLVDWLWQLLDGNYDRRFVQRRLEVGRTHVAVGLDQALFNVALSRMRNKMIDTLREHWDGTADELVDTIESLNKLLDLDLAIIQDAYRGEDVRIQRVTERTRMKHALHQEREFSEGLLEQAQAIVLVLDVKGRIVRYNPYLEELSGIRLGDVKGQDWFDTFLPSQDRQRLREVFQDVIARCDTSGSVCSIRTRSGSEHQISWSNKVLKDVQGRTVAMLALGQDISELNEAQQRALQAERLAAIGQMSTGLAHEGRNALQRIQACAEMLEIEVEGNENAVDLVRRIKLAQDHMHRLFDEVRGYAAPIQLDRQPCHLVKIWREAWEMLLPLRANREAELIENVSCSELAYEGDRFRLVRLFRILFENSLAACSDPVRICIVCERTSLGEWEAIQISVLDNGPGLNSEQREHIFDPFFTTKTRGTGLGMAIAQRIVETHGGKVRVGGEVGPGAEIVITLPLVESD